MRVGRGMGGGVRACDHLQRGPRHKLEHDVPLVFFWNEELLDQLYDVGVLQLPGNTGGGGEATVDYPRFVAGCNVRVLQVCERKEGGQEGVTVNHHRMLMRYVGVRRVGWGGGAAAADKGGNAGDA